ncbi:phosphatidylcholine:diacylglycerol cholinephosphotransferase 1-like [Hibiscus syriacus]|uniref:phosphatidylcholine:diacylglycerol cholinephosphotransferase 1-like n=1 Tax=Hibiscus syriacus TaxID=106335 RepID=UPI0019246D45|nr:phosphatidylcholine:diacylglycerol cholinephosphotransferase 1-like [Hibiscus syriacus]
MTAAEATVATTTLLSPRHKRSGRANGKGNGVKVTASKKTGVHHSDGDISHGKASFMKWTLDDVVYVAKYHRIPCFFATGLLFFIFVEYTLRMVPDSSPPFDLGFVVTRSFHRVLASWPELNSILAALNTEFVGSGMDFPVGNVSFFLFFSGHIDGSVIASLDMRRMQ